MQYPSFSSVNIFPNPVITELNIQLDNLENQCLHIFNSCGQKIITKTLSTNNYMVDMTNWSKGLYVVDIIDPKTGLGHSYKIIKK